MYYLLGEEFDRDPFLIFRLRGLDRDELVALIGADAARREAAAEPVAGSRRSRCPSDPAAFWRGGELPPDVTGDVPTAPDAAAALVQRLGRFPFWRGRQPLLDAVRPAYEAASPLGLQVFLGERRLRTSTR